MSNIGKSHWARRLKHDHGFEHFEVDDRIQENLSLNSIARSASWMGHPYDTGYADKAEKYLTLESEMTQLAEEIAGNVVIDTTGSVIYLDDELQKALKDKCLVVYLRAQKDDLERLETRFTTSPKPLIWGDHYHEIEGVDNHSAMMSLYPSLLKKRDRMYAAISDIVVKATYIGRKTDVLNKIREALPD